VAHAESLLGTTLQTRTFTSADITADTADYVNNKDFKFVLFEVYQPIPSTTQPSALEDFIEKRFKYVFDWDSSDARMVDYAIRHIKTPIGVLTYKEHRFPTQIRKVFVIYSGNPQEQIVFNSLQYIPSDIEVTVMANDDTVFNNLTNTNLSFIKAKRPFRKWKTEGQKDKGYDLIIAGASRASRDIFESDLIETSLLPVLLLYASSGSQQELKKTEEVALPA